MFLTAYLSFKKGSVSRKHNPETVSLYSLCFLVPGVVFGPAECYGDIVTKDDIPQETKGKVSSIFVGKLTFRSRRGRHVGAISFPSKHLGLWIRK